MFNDRITMPNNFAFNIKITMRNNNMLLFFAEISNIYNINSLYGGRWFNQYKVIYLENTGGTHSGLILYF